MNGAFPDYVFPVDVFPRWVFPISVESVFSASAESGAFDADIDASGYGITGTVQPPPAPVSVYSGGLAPAGFSATVSAANYGLTGSGESAPTPSVDNYTVAIAEDAEYTTMSSEKYEVEGDGE